MQNLYSFTRNAGKGNYTIFAEIIRQKQGIDLQGFPWCATFVHAVVDKPELLGRAHPGTHVLARRMKRKGLWRTASYDPQEGDLVFFAYKGNIYHVGIVQDTDDDSISVLSGNTVDPTGVFGPNEGGAVAVRVYDREDDRIEGYGAIAGCWS